MFLSGIAPGPVIQNVCGSGALRPIPFAIVPVILLSTSPVY